MAVTAAREVPTLPNVRRHRARLRTIASAEGVTILGVFGSVARGEAKSGSDIDLLVDVADTVGLLALGRVRGQISTLLGAEVDLVPVAGLKPSVRADVARDLEPL